jgi:hypothetical protein
MEIKDGNDNIFQGEFTEEDVYDLWALSVKAGSLSITTCSANTQIDTIIQLYADEALSTQVTEAGDDFESCLVGAQELASIITADDLDEGTYYLVVRTTGSETIGSYEVKITATYDDAQAGGASRSFVSVLFALFAPLLSLLSCLF